MKLTPLDSTELTLLKVGDKVWIPDNCATTKPSKEIRRATLRIFKQQKLLLEVEQTNKSLINTANERDSWQTKANELKEQNKEANTERDTWKGKADEFERQTKELAKHKGSVWSYVIGGIVGAILAYCVFWFQLHRLVNEKLSDLERISALEEELRISNEKQTELRRRLAALTSQGIVLVVCDGEELPFPISSKAMVRCAVSDCPATMIADEQHILAHMNKVHRLTKITPNEMRIELARAN